MIWLILVPFFFIGLATFGYIWEKKDFNSGNCPVCYNRLVQFDTDSQGGHGYTCENRGHLHYTTWVSYPGIVGG